MRRLDLHPAKRLRGARRHARAFHAAMDRLDALTPPQAGERFANFKVPAFQKALSPLHGAPSFRRDVVARLIASADRMARRTPARVAALIDWPDLFGSEVCVFFRRRCRPGLGPPPPRCRTPPRPDRLGRRLGRGAGARP